VRRILPKIAIKALGVDVAPEPEEVEKGPGEEQADPTRTGGQDEGKKDVGKT